MSSGRSNPTIIAIEAIDLFHPLTESEETLERIDFQGFEGASIANHEAVEDRISDGWVPRGIEGKIRYESVKYNVRISGNSKMGYVKIEDIGNIDRAQELQDILRERFLEYFRLDR